MDQLVSFDAILIPSDGRYPHVVALTTSPVSVPDPHAPYSTQPTRMPHPEVHMDYIAEGLGPRAWHYHVSTHSCILAILFDDLIVYYSSSSRRSIA